jgi:hypothetical protein
MPVRILSDASSGEASSLCEAVGAVCSTFAQFVPRLKNAWNKIFLIESKG